MTRNTVYLAAIHTLLLVVSAAYLATFAFSGGDADDVRYFYDNTAAFYQRTDANTLPGRTLFLGDSLVQGLAVNSITETAVNFGIGHETVSGAAERLLHYGALQSAKQVFIAVGINDILRDDEAQALEQYKALLATLPKSLDVVISLVMPVDEDFEHLVGVNQKILRFNEALERISQEQINQGQPNLRLLHTTGQFADENGNLHDNLHVGDGLHLSPPGNELWISRLRELVKQPGQ